MRWFAVVVITGVLGAGISWLSTRATRAGELLTEEEVSEIDVSEVMSGGPPPQGIPALGFEDERGEIESSSEPEFVSISEAAEWVEDEEPVIVATVGDEARAYPMQVMTWHEIVNDTLAETPIAVTFCPLCNSALAFDRRLAITTAQREKLEDFDTSMTWVERPDSFRDDGDDGDGDDGRLAEEALLVTFGTTGKLYRSNLLMFDSATHTMWSQAIGEGAVGVLSGNELERIPAQIVSFESFRKAYPDARVLSKETGYERSYGRNPYVGYDKADEPPVLYRGELDGRLSPKARVVTMQLGETAVAYPFDALESKGVIHDEVAGKRVVVLWQEGTRSGLDTSKIATGRDVGAVGAFHATLDGEAITLEARDGGFFDEESGSEFDIFGRAVSGPLEGKRLTPIPHDNTLWFAWAAFRPNTRIYGE